ncbi:MAG TPA: dienelactone hydrolase family protein [Sphingomonas sp.]|nr:dienelactone hydrolase family protein [Sphingomonas sp.]
MAIGKRAVRYEVGGATFESLVVWDGTATGKRPAVLIAPTFMGRSPFEEEKAERLAALGYVGFAIDIFGVDVRPAGAEEATAAMQALNADRRAIAARMAAALEAARGLETVDAAKVAVIGFCFGGKCALDLARTGADVKGVVTFHGLFDAPDHPTAGTIPASILALHGWEDPLATPQDVIAFADEMTAKKADWQLHAYGHTKHSFTAKHRPDKYREAADRRSWRAMQDFLSELFV